MHAARHHETSLVDRIIDRTTAIVRRLGFLLGGAIIVITWIIPGITASLELTT
jgi:uncharacterized membrane protein